MPTKKKTIDSYNKHADSWSKRLEKGENIAHDYLEKPAMYSKLPDLDGQSVLCIGCGSGEECYEFLKRGASRVLGIDVAEGLISIAQTKYPDVEFKVMDMEQMEFNETFDFIYSSLALHYVEDWVPVLDKIYKHLSNQGSFVFSTHHPVKWSGQTIRERESSKHLLGYKKSSKPEELEIYGDYLNTREINDVWFGDFEVSFYHKSISSIFGDIRSTGFKVADFIEPKATIECRDKHPVFYEIHQKIPKFMIFELKKDLPS